MKNGVPFLPHAPAWLPLEQLNGRMQAIELATLDVVDVVVSKLARFSIADQSDIKAMVDRGLVPPDRLIARFRAAVDELAGDARAPRAGAYLENLHRVERDMLGVEETHIELPAKY